ncbi:DEKNAAC102812 [Brettanomyces naardenensis]|uniref:DEKNAAC102812 n=1 Tax=Brettanomyces naardenensis TaxID=13370 RepID=A0A448YLU4_BRENA|nr:DEKNAAC102812 [Brettanomyces naardenensis]
MFSIITSTAGLAVSIIYPLYRTYGLLSEDKNSQLARQIVENLSGTVNVPKEKMDQLEECIAYWIILSLSYFVGSIQLISLILGMIPFGSFIILYLKVWLVFPIVPLDTGSVQKVSGTYIIYHYYLDKLLQDLCIYINSYTASSKNAYNELIDTYLSPATFLKLDIRGGQQQQQQPSEADAFSRSQSSSLSDTTQRDPASIGRLFSELLWRSDERSEVAGATIPDLPLPVPAKQPAQESDPYSTRILLDSIMTPIGSLTNRIVAMTYAATEPKVSPSSLADDSSSTSLGSTATVDGFELVTDLVDDRKQTPSEATGRSGKNDLPGLVLKTRTTAQPGGAQVSGGPEVASRSMAASSSSRKSSWVLGFRSRTGSDSK